MNIDINHEKINPDNIPWGDLWKYFNVRITKLPFTDDIESYDEKSIAADWAVRSVAMIMSLMNIEQIEDELYYEGGLKRAETNRYERNPVNRELCLAANGYKCMICGFDFEEKYGVIGHHFIHVHHIEQVSLHLEEYLINPVTDLLPVCPNCHAMLHRSDPPLKPDELKTIIEKMKE
jgi:Predicted restriction endonuclease